ncbi:MAG: ArnT family glycosyltransferase [Candidatus Methylomirabilales bacterium]
MRKRSWTETLVWNEPLAILFLVVVAFTLRLWVALTAEGITTDGTAYVQVARAFARGDILDGIQGYPQWGPRPFHWPPLYPLLIACLSPVVPDLELGGRLVSATAGTLLILPGYVLGRRIFGTNIGLLSALFLAFHARLIYFGGSVGTESTYMLIGTAAVERGWAAIEGRRVAPLLAASSLAGLAYLTRPEGVGIPVVLTAWIIWRMARGPEPRQVVAALGVLAAGFVPFSAPYILFMQYTTGTWMLSGKLRVPPVYWILLAGSLLVLIIMMELIRQWLLREKYAVLWLLGCLVMLFLLLEMFGPPEDPLPHLVLVREGPIAFFRALGISLVWEVKRFPEALTLAPYLLLLICICCRSTLPSEPLGEAYLRTVIFFYLGLFALWFPRRRFLIQLVPYVLPWAGVGLLELQERTRAWLERRYGKNRAGEMAKRGMAVLLVVIVMTHAPFVLQLGKGRVAEKQIGLRLRPLVAPNTLIMARRPQVAFYAGGAYRPTAGGPFAAALADARSHGVQYWLIKISRVPEWKEDLEAAEQRGELKRIDAAENSRGEQFILFRLGGASHQSLGSRR